MEWKKGARGGSINEADESHSNGKGGMMLFFNMKKDIGVEYGYHVQFLGTRYQVLLFIRGR